MRSPPLSPSKNMVTSLFLLISMIVFGIFVPFIPIAFFIPHLRRFRTSALPSTIIIASLSNASDPAGNCSGPIEII